MNCDEFRAGYLAGEDSDSSRRHVEGCAACRSRLSDLDAGRAALADPSLWEEPSPDLALQVEALIGSNRRSEPRKPPGWIRPLAAAAAVLLAVGGYAVLRPPTADWEVVVPGTDLAPRASATVLGWNTSSGTRMVLRTEGLDPAPEGLMYEFWLSRGPVHISAGTFTGGGRIELWTGVARADFPRLWVTLEPIDEDESPSALTVLDTGRP